MKPPGLFQNSLSAYLRGGARMAAWWSRSPLRPPLPLVRPESGTGHRPSWPPTGKAAEGMVLLLLHVTPAAQRRHWSGVHVGIGASLTGPEGSSQRPTVANTGLRPQPGPDVTTTSPKGLVHDPGFKWLPCDWASVSLSVMRGAGRGNCSCLVTGSDHP